MANQKTYVTRLTWNINGWTRPSGAIGKKEYATYVAKHGFGHEEWLNRGDCEINGWRYGFLQGVYKQRKRLTGTVMRILLYSINPSGERLYVGELESTEIIDNKTEQHALKVFGRRGLLQTMQHEATNAGGRTQGFKVGLNIRFRPDALKIYQRPIPAKSWDRILKFSRYAVVPAAQRVSDWWKLTKKTRKPWVIPPSTDPVIYERIARSVKMEFTERKMQHEIKSILEAEFGKGTVKAESNYRDLKLRSPHRRALIEIKANEDARLAIRAAFGQVLEYAYFDPPDRNNGDELFIVGQGPMTPEAQDFLAYISSRFGLNVTYLQYRVGSNQLQFPMKAKAA
jgi:hypothetical protein